MRVSADKQLRRLHQQTAADGRVVITGISADMLYQHFGSVYGEAIDLRIDLADLLSVNVTIHGAQRTKSIQLLRHFQRTDIACMPYFIAILEVFQVFIVPK